MNEKGVGNDSTQKTVFHFSDGTMKIPDTVNSISAVNESNECDKDELNWGPWAMQKSMVVGGKALKVCDYLGESLASFFGITTPKYQYEINEYYRLLKEKEEQREKDLEMGAWSKEPLNEIVQEQVLPGLTDLTVRY